MGPAVLGGDERAQRMRGFSDGTRLSMVIFKQSFLI
jgi:hypothetical protein